MGDLIHNLVLIAVLGLNVVSVCRGEGDEYYGKLIGEFTRRGDSPSAHHNVSGTVYAVDDNTLQIIGFTYDGEAPEAFFYIGTSGEPSGNGSIIPKALGLGGEVLGEYSNEDLVIKLDPLVASDDISDFRWISVWCRRCGLNFADVYIPSDFTPPGEHSLGRLALDPVVHGVTVDRVVIVNSKQIRFEGLSYDGRGPDAYFWMDTNAEPSTQGTRVPQVGEDTASKLNRRLSGVTRTVQLPGSTTVFDIRSIGLWCVQATQNFGHVVIPADLKSRGVVIPFGIAPDEQTYDNCVVLREDEFQVSWTVDSDNNEIAIRLSGRMLPNEYMAFGPSGSDTGTDMVGSDVVVAYIASETSMAVAEDYFLSARSQCVTNTGDGVCPDVRSSGENNVMLSGFLTEDGITQISYRRPLTADDIYDKAIVTTGDQFVSWAQGPINSDGLATRHGGEQIPQGNVVINFGSGSSQCPSFTDEDVDDQIEKFDIEPIVAYEDAEFRCDIGQSGGSKGYQGITGEIGWGIAWYINGNLIPEITVKRNQTYTFKVYGGSNPAQSASYHPFYITDSAAGGLSQLSENSSARLNHRIYAGPVNGSYCIYEETSESPNPNDANGYEAYRNTLELDCPNGQDQPGTLVWTPNVDTPDVVYYQCYTHTYLGWKIHVTDDANRSFLSTVTLVTALIVAILLTTI